MSRKVPRGRDDEEALTADIIALAREYGRYGSRKITALLRAAGWGRTPSAWSGSGGERGTAIGLTRNPAVRAHPLGA